MSRCVCTWGWIEVRDHEKACKQAAPCWLLVSGSSPCWLFQKLHEEQCAYKCATEESTLENLRHLWNMHDYTTLRVTVSRFEIKMKWEQRFKVWNHAIRTASGPFSWRVNNEHWHSDAMSMTSGHVFIKRNKEFHYVHIFQLNGGWFSSLTWDLKMMSLIFTV